MPPGIAITVQADTFVPPPTHAPGIVPPGIAITMQADTFVPLPTRAPGIVPPGPVFAMLLEALTFYAVEPMPAF